MAQTGIRSYGPGKFYKVIDGYAYELTLDGGADRSYDSNSYETKSGLVYWRTD
jgi:hypothetical protein